MATGIVGLPCAAAAVGLASRRRPLPAAQAGQDLGLNVEWRRPASQEWACCPVFAQGDAEVLLIHASDEAMG